MSGWNLLRSRYFQTGSLLCIGLDPRCSIENIEEWVRTIISQTHKYALAYKANVAFFEQYGVEGIKLLSNLRDYIPEDIPLILDAKRCDIDSTAQAYKTSLFQIYKADLVTVIPYMGSEIIEQFDNCFAICVSSNKSRDTHLFQSNDCINSILNICTNSGNGIVVGATKPEQLLNIRQRFNNWILVPGIGAQGGNLEEVIRNGYIKDKGLLLINVSRGIGQTTNPGKVAKEYFDKIEEFKKSCD